MSHTEEDKELTQLFPFVRRWKTIYLFVLGELVVLILMFYLFGRYFS